MSASVNVNPRSVDTAGPPPLMPGNTLRLALLPPPQARHYKHQHEHQGYQKLDAQGVFHNEFTSLNNVECMNTVGTQHKAT